MGVPDDGDVSDLSTGRATGRIEVIARMTRRRHWTPAEKIKMLAEAFGPGGSVRGAARRFELTTGLLYTWRGLHRSGKLGADGAAEPPSFVRVELAPTASRLPGPSQDMVGAAAPSSGVIAVEMPSGAREAWEAEGYTVRGAALSGIAAENVEGGSAIALRTIASLEHQWSQSRELLAPRDVLVIDEAGMIGSRQMERVLSAARDAASKVVLVGDPEQLQAIEAGAAFRSIAERHGAVEITEIPRQRED